MGKKKLWERLGESPARAWESVTPGKAADHKTEDSEATEKSWVNRLLRKMPLKGNPAAWLDSQIISARRVT